MAEAEWTSLGDWVAAFRQLHAAARAGRLKGEDRAAYERERDSLAAALFAAQRLSVRPGQAPRKALRIARALPVELSLPEGSTRASTVDLALGGFAVLLERPPRVGQRMEFSLELKAQRAVVRGSARVVNLQRKGKPFRVAFAFEGLPDAQAREVELEVFDAALAQVP